ncbi:MAG: multicopper oxidase domain-containing protein [Sphingomonadaceae bacterium]
MIRRSSPASLTRRDFLKLGGGVLGAMAGSNLVARALLQPEKAHAATASRAPARSVAPATNAQTTAPSLHLVATDGWISLPPEAVVFPYHPDDMAPEPFTTYIFGFRDVTSVSANGDLVAAQKMKAQLTAPLFWIEQEADYTLRLSNLGLRLRPDLVDAHTVHFHGFRNAIPVFDGEPHSSVGVPIKRDLTYFYRPHHPGTYMYHCHFEEIEHVHMGMIGPCFVTPIQNYGRTTPGGPEVVTPARLGGNTDPGAPRGYCYNDGDGSTAYDREFVLVLSEIWAESHWCDSHIQLPEWSDYKPDFYLINGRAYPDTLLPNGAGTDPATGDLMPPPGHPELQYQPTSSLIQANAGDRVLLRIINLGYEEHAMRLDGIKMRVVGKDASLLRGRDGADLTYLTNTVVIGPGESVDAIFVAPPHTGTAGYDRFLFYNRNYHRLSNGGHTGYGGQMTEVRVFPAGALPAQTAPNT